MRSLLQDVRCGLRVLRKSPGFTIVAVLTLALGIGANTALFSIVNGVLLNPLPFPDSGQLVALYASKPNFDKGSISYLNFLDWQKDNHTFSSIAAYRPTQLSLTGNGEAERLNGEFLTSDFFPQLGVKPVIGRAFLPGEDRVGAAPVALISRGLWKRKFGGAHDVLGKAITLDGRNYTIVGVIPETFHLYRGFQDSAVYVPIGQWNNGALLNREAGLGIRAIGRLKPGVTIAQARADMESVTRNLAAAYPDTDKGIGAALVPLKEAVVGRVRPSLLILLGAVGFVLLIACLNVANLLLARSTGRLREFAIRAALGATRSRIIGQLLTESVMLAAAGGAVGLLLAVWGTRAALGVLPEALPRAENIHLDGQVLVFTLAISVLAGIFFGLAPALRTSRHDLHMTLQEGGRGLSGMRHRAQGVFVIVEMAMALVLLVGAGLMIRSLTQLWSMDPGFKSSNVLTFSVALPPAMQRGSTDAIRASLRELHRKIDSVPGVQATSLSWGAFPMGDDDEQLFWQDGQSRPASENDMNWAVYYVVESDYLKAMQIPLKRGRFFTAQDDEHAPQVVVVDEVLAGKYFPDGDAVGKRINMPHRVNGRLLDTSAQIVGVVGHVKQWGLDNEDKFPLQAQLYRPLMQLPDDAMVLSAAGIQVVTRSNGSSSVFGPIRQTLGQMSNEQVLYGVESMEGMIADSLASKRFSMILLGAFAVLALLLASIGIYGVIAYLVGQRTHEIGIRMALGAERGDILRLILGRGGRLVLTGIGIGVAVALLLTRFMATLLSGVSASDPLTFAGVAVLLTVVAMAACYVPARRAANVDPMVALRYE